LRRFGIVILFTTLLPITAWSENNVYPEWFTSFYLGEMTNNQLGRVLIGDFSLNPTTLYSIEIGKELSPNNPFRCFFQPIMSSISVRANFTFLKDQYDKICEINPYIAFDWKFPARFLNAALSIGEGLSYVSKVPFAEEMYSDQTKKLLNFLLCDLTFSLPKLPQWEAGIRVHHRSGAFGLYHANNSGSTAIGVVLRYRF
jgi:hypothetical protein